MNYYNIKNSFLLVNLPSYARLLTKVRRLIYFFPIMSHVFSMSYFFINFSSLKLIFCSVNVKKQLSNFILYLSSICLSIFKGVML